MIDHRAVLLVGPDGAGKSTVVDELRSLLSNRGVEVRSAHLRPGLIGRRRPSGPVTAPHRAAPRSVAASLAKLALWWADTVLGWLGPWRIGRKRGVLLIERGWFDQTVDPVRYRIPPTTRGLAKWLGRTLPRMDLGVLLVGDPLAIVARKPELQVEEVQRQILTWRGVLPLAALDTMEIDTTSSSAPLAAEAIIDRLDATPLLRHVPFTAGRLELACSAGPSGRVAARIYRPQKGRAALAAGFGLRLAALGPRASHEATAAARAAVLVAETALDLRPGGVAVMRSSAPERWIVGGADETRLGIIAKVGPTDDTGLITETELLENLQGAAVRVPRLLAVRECHGRLVLVTEAEDVGTGAPLSIDELATLCQRIAAAGVRHGDLAPWNVLRVPGDVVVIDWEHGGHGADPLADFAHYLCQEGTLLGRWTPREAADILSDHPATGALTAGGDKAGAPLMGRLRPSYEPRCRAFRKEVARCLAD